MNDKRGVLPVYDPAQAPVLVTQEGAVGIITLNRPEKRNALNFEVIAGVKAAIAELNADDPVRVIVITGAGPDFCAGADLVQLERIAEGASVMENLNDAQSLGDLFIRMRHSPKPIVAAVRGNAIAGGAGLACACDIVLADDEAMFGFPEVHLGFVPAMVMALLRRAVGEKVAFELVSRGNRIDADEAWRLGLVNGVYEADAFEDEVALYTRELAQRSASAVALTKRLLYGIDNTAFEDAIARGAEVNAMARGTDDCRAGVRRFLDRQRGS